MSNKAIDVFKHVQMPPDGDITPCWPWTGTINAKDNRPYFTMRGVKWLAYRLVYIMVKGTIPEGQVLRHKCDNSICCNPYHLEPGSQSDNEKDKYARDRYGFTHAVIEDIMKLHKKGVHQREIAAIVSNTHGVFVTQQRVSDITTGVRRAGQTKPLQ
jgi:hypothetical protein